MQATTLGEIRAAVADRADLPVLSATTFITSDTMLRWINQSMLRLAGKLVAAYGEGHYETSQTIETAAGSAATLISGSEATPPIPLLDKALTDIYRVISLNVTLDGQRIQLEQGNRSHMDVEGDNASLGWSLSDPPRWRFAETPVQIIRWSKTPQAVHSVTVHYVPYFVGMSEGSFGEDTGLVPTGALADDNTDRISSHMGWDEWVVLDCAIKAMVRQGLPPVDWQPLKLERDEIESEFKPAANKRTATPKRIQRKWRGRRSRVRP